LFRGGTVIAQRDIRFSNSPIEAINKIFKQYLRHYTIWK